jgi:hypothetical protein
VVSCALWGDYSEELAADADDEDLDSDAWETAFLASLAESSTPDQPDYDLEARRASGAGISATLSPPSTRTGTPDRHLIRAIASVAPRTAVGSGPPPCRAAA